MQKVWMAHLGIAQRGPLPSERLVGGNVGQRLASILPKKGDRGIAVGFSSGVRHWIVPVEFTGLYEVDELGWMLGYRAETTGGASGGGIFSSRGELVAIENIALPQFPMLSFGVPVGRIRQALRDYDLYGSMKDRI